MENNPSARPMHSIGLWFSISLIISSLILGFALSRLHATQPFVDVKGLAEREVAADLARWKINFSLAANDWSVLQKNIAKQTNTIVQFLHKEGLSNDEIVKQIPTIRDYEAERRYREEEQKNRYKANLCVTVLSRNIPAVQAAVLKAGTLLKQGILINFRDNDYDPDLEFSFTKLNDIKPAMIREATLNARKAADQFAQDSGSKVGNIRHARQGQFSITATERPAIKKVRVVTNIRYTLSK
ncbi:MAG: SIMPL domain-containing protein [Bacteroidota bacterium]